MKRIFCDKCGREIKDGDGRYCVPARTALYTGSIESLTTKIMETSTRNPVTKPFLFLGISSLIWIEMMKPEYGSNDIDICMPCIWEAALKQINEEIKDYNDSRGDKCKLS